MEIRDSEYHIVITPPKRWFRIGIQELWNYRELAYFFVWREIKVRYKQTAIGIIWAVLQPLVAMVIFSVFFGRLVKVPSDNIPYPIFVYSGLLLWNFFSFGLTHASNSMVENSGIIRKIYFPRLIIPISSSLAGFIDLFFSSIVLVGLMVYFQFIPSITIVFYLPLLFLISFLSAVGLGCVLAALNVKYRDVRYALPFFIQMLLFVTPVIYPTSVVNPSHQWIMAINPMASVIETARGVLFHSNPVNGMYLLVSLGSAIFIFLVGIIFFRKTEYYFADII